MKEEDDHTVAFALKARSLTGQTERAAGLTSLLNQMNYLQD